MKLPSLLLFVAALSACASREKMPPDSAPVRRDSTLAVVARDTAKRAAAQPYNPDDSGPPDTPQSLALWADRKKRGVDFFGVGQEPGWMIEIDEGTRLYLLANYAEDTVDVVAPAPAIDPAVPGRRVYRTEGDGHTVEVTIEPRPCSDAMSGKRYAETVLLTLDGKSYDGCGRRVQ
jgi:uncharacterized membrane protein